MPLSLKVTKWDDFNPRKDQKAASWFRMQNDFLADPKFWRFSSDQKMVWLYILSECSKRMKGSIQMEPGLAAAMIRVDQNLVQETLTEFAAMGLISICDGGAELAKPAEPEQTETIPEPKPDPEPDNVKQLSPIACTGREQITYPNGSGRYERTNERYVHNNPPNPPLQGGAPSRKQVDSEVEQILAAIKGATQTANSPEEAREQIGEVGWKLLGLPYPDYGGFIGDLRKAIREKRDGLFWRDLGKQIRAIHRNSEYYKTNPIKRIGGN